MCNSGSDSDYCCPERAVRSPNVWLKATMRFSANQRRAYFSPSATKEILCCWCATMPPTEPSWATVKLRPTTTNAAQASTLPPPAPKPGSLEHGVQTGPSNALEKTASGRALTHTEPARAGAGVKPSWANRPLHHVSRPSEESRPSLATAEATSTVTKKSWTWSPFPFCMCTSEPPQPTARKAPPPPPPPPPPKSPKLTIADLKAQKGDAPEPCPLCSLTIKSTDRQHVIRGQRFHHGPFTLCSAPSTRHSCVLTYPWHHPQRVWPARPAASMSPLRARSGTAARLTARHATERRRSGACD